MKRGRPKKKHNVSKKEIVMPVPKKEVKLPQAPKKDIAPDNENVISDANETLAHEE